MPNDALPLADHVAVVTGASSGIGLGVAAAVGEAGAAVVINYNSHAEPARELASKIRESGGRAIAVQADVSQEDDVIRLFDEAATAFGRIDVVIPNVGIQKDAAIADLSLDDWNTVIQVNLTGHSCVRAKPCDASGFSQRTGGPLAVPARL